MMGKTKEESNGRTSRKNTSSGSDGKAIEDLREIEELANEMAKKTSDYEKELSKLRAQHDDLVRKNLELNQKLSEVETKSSANAARILDMNNRKEALGKKLSLYEKENKDLKEKNDDLSEKLEQGEKELKTSHRNLKDQQADTLRLKEEVNLASGRDAQGKPKQYKRSESDEKLLRDKDDQIAALKRELDQVKKVSGKVRQDIQHHR